MSAPEGSGWATAGFVVGPEETVVDLVDSKPLPRCGPVPPFGGNAGSLLLSTVDHMAETHLAAVEAEWSWTGA